MSARSMMDADQMHRAITRLGHEIVERHGGTDGLVLIGIQRRGAVLAHRLADAVAESEQVRLPVGALDISLYRDDLSELATYPIVRSTELPFDISDRTVVLIDDVLFTGPHRPRGDGRVARFRTSARDPTRGARRSWSPRAADPSGPRGPEPSDCPNRASQRPCTGARRCRRGRARCASYDVGRRRRRSARARLRQRSESSR